MCSTVGITVRCAASWLLSLSIISQRDSGLSVSSGKSVRLFFVVSRLHQNSNGVAVLICGPPQILVFSLNGKKDFVEVPGAIEAAMAFLEFLSIGWAKLLPLLTNGFVGHRDASFGEEFFHFTETQGESMVQPDGMTDNFGGEPVMLLVFNCTN